MIRVFAILACAAALSLSLPMGIDGAALAQGKSMAKSGVKQCRAKAPSGRIVKWKCQADQPCCMNTTTGKGVCGSPIIGCL